jgi:hypothetical protein
MITGIMPGMITPMPFLHLQIRTELSDEDIAFVTGHTTRAVRGWRSGQNPVPLYVYMFMRAVEDKRLDVDWILAEVEKFNEEAA